MSNLYDKDVVCPVCTNKFKTLKVRAKGVKIDKRNSDLSATYVNEDPTYYGVFVCPMCGHARFESDFNDVNVKAKDLIISTVSQKWAEQNFCGERILDDAIRVHKLALINYTASQYKKSAVAKACLRLSWYLKDSPKGEDVKFRELTVSSYETAYSTESFADAPKEELTILYILGETCRSLGRYQDAMKWFGIAMKTPTFKENKMLADMIRDQIQETKAGLKAEKAAQGES